MKETIIAEIRSQPQRHAERWETQLEHDGFESWVYLRGVWPSGKVRITIEKIRECYYPSRGCEYNEGESCDAPNSMFFKCQGEIEDSAYQSWWERQHEPPENSEFTTNSEEEKECP